MHPIILASASPRRQDLLTMLGLEFKVIASSFEERAKLDPAAPPAEQVVTTARGKAEEVFRLTASVPETADSLVIGADTIVVLDGEVLGKPADQAEARRMLKTLSGRWHQVFTGLALLHREKTLTAYEMTRVHFRPLTDREIDAYLRTGEPMDKAGAYGIQGLGAIFVDRIEGCFYNVMGLPVPRLALLLKEYGINLPEVKTLVGTGD
ncbi:septum formation inhibitor Maf [Hydrogenispora sp. UU3]|uniref:dTTP/UTP pyrophosphatase n=1 Tax=Capillibacterium thermochitinicola TaxID=2699427 RepID=A0A8J6HSR8_9FIRM|nr:septum formation inhibitor Maf [Capillibacterium thermochitinicola]